ncbi:MAG: hypothetical protein RLZZ23_1494 [Verrucomicrobiota bacterium]|jgi:hypothetical protein
MTKLIHPYSLQAFPTEKILKEFKPVRGCHVHGKIELPPGQAELLWASLRNRDSDPLAWQQPTVEVDIGPLTDAIAERMGYDPRLLNEGRGETGRTEHAWSVYADESGFPLLIRWQAGAGELLLSIGILAQEKLSIAILADAEGLETLLKVHDIVTGIVATEGRTERLSVPVGDTLQIVEVTSPPERAYFGPCVTLCLPSDRQLSDLRRKELERIVGGVPLFIGTEEEINRRQMYVITTPPLKPNSLRLEMIPPSATRLDFGPDEPLSQSLIDLINEAGVSRTWREFERTAAEHAYVSFDANAWDELLDKEKLDFELSERRLKLGELLRRMSPSDDCQRIHRISFSRDFQETPATHLRGTGPMAKMAEGNVETSADLLDKLRRLLLDLCRPPLMAASAEAKPKLQIKGECQLPPLASQYQDTALEQKGFEELTKPYTSTHRGLPVRVDKRVLVWRSNDTEALAADYFRHPTTGDVHFARLYRTSTPKA